jgi:hypothetical protein
VCCSDETAEDVAALAPGQCRDTADCQAAATCVPPGVERVCGGAGCPDHECSADLDCVTAGLGDICVSIEGVRLCRPGCGADNPCGASEACNALLRCEPKACAADAECPENCSCAPNVCRRRLCSDDGACQGYCVRGECYDAPGVCELPAA